MKKKIFLVSVMLVIFACALTIAVGATAINKDTTVTLDGSFTDASGNAVTEINLYDDDGDALIWYLNTDGALVSAKIASLVTVNSEGVISFTDQTVFLNSTPSKSVIAVNLRDNVKVSGTDINWDGQIKHFDSSKGTANEVSLASTGFQFGTYGGSGYTIQYFYFPTTAQSIVKRMFQGTPVKVADIEPGTPISTIGVLVFYGASKLESIYIPNDIEIFTSSEGQGVFQNCSSLSSVTFEENSTLWHAGYNTFNGCSNLKKLFLPNSVKTIGSEFARSSGIEEFSFGAGFEYFSMRRAGTDPDSAHMWVFWNAKLKKVYMPASFAILNDEYAFEDYVSADERLDTFDRIFNSAGSFTLFFTGTKEEIETLKTRIAYTQENQSLVSSLNTIYSYDEYIAAGSPSGSLAVYDYSQCDAFYNGAHKNETKVVYEGFHKSGEKIVGCASCNKNEKTVLPALFTCSGYSAAENGAGGVAVGFKVNAEAIAAYTSLTGKTIKYGVFAVSQSKLGENNIFDSQGNAASGVISAEIQRTDFSAFDIKVVGFETDLLKSTSFALGAYVEVSNGATTEYSYMQSGTPNEGEKYCFVSYNDVVGKQS